MLTFKKTSFKNILTGSKIEAQSCFPLPSFIVYMYESSTLAKSLGIKVCRYWEHFEEHIENLGNALGT
jgi:hypothetical protein